MTSNHFTTVYDFGSVSFFSNPFIYVTFFILLLNIFGFLAWKFVFSSVSNNGIENSFMSHLTGIKPIYSCLSKIPVLVCVVLPLPFCLICVCFCLYEYLTLEIDYTTGNTKIAEGFVTNFVPYDISNRNHYYMERGREEFAVEGVQFSYSPNVLTYAYHEPRAAGGVIQPDQYVKIVYVNRKNAILKIEIRSDSQ